MGPGVRVWAEGRAAGVTESVARDFETVRGTAGYWRLGQTRQGVWWYLSPENQAEFLNTVTTVQPVQAGESWRTTTALAKGG